MGIILLIHLFLFIYIFICLINNELFFWVKKAQNISQESNGSKINFYGELSKCKRIDDCLENSDYKEYTFRKLLKKLFSQDEI